MQSMHGMTLRKHVYDCDNDNDNERDNDNDSDSVPTSESKTISDCDNDNDIADMPSEKKARVDPAMSHIARNFQNMALSRGNLVPGMIPGIAERACLILKDNGINTADKLVGKYFLLDRNEVAFIEYLESIGILNQFARECAKNIVTKFEMM